MSPDQRSARVGAIVGGVITQTLADAGAAGLLVLEDATPEGRLLVHWAATALGADRVHTSPADTAYAWMAAGGPGRERAELRRAAARLIAAEHNWLLAHPANKTAILLSREPPPERLLPMGDLYASQILELTGGCTLPAEVDAIAAATGGVNAVDGVLAAWLDERRDLDSALARLGADAANALRQQLRRSRAARRWPRIVPKLGARTLWVDLCA